MITRLYVNNFRCLVAFEARFEPLVVLCGHNGSGKSAVFDVLRLIRDLAAGDAILGGDRESDIPHLEFTKWLQSDVQEFELSLTSAGHEFQYLVHLQQVVAKEKPRIVKERATCDGRTLFERNLESVRFYRLDGTEAGSFPLDWRQAALAAIQPHGHLADVEALQKAMANLVILRPNPRDMERESKAELRRPDLYLAGLTSWYRWLAQDFERAKILHDQLREVWPDCRSLGLVDVGLNTKALQLRFDGINGGGADGLYFEQLSDGEKALIALYPQWIRRWKGSNVIRAVDCGDRTALMQRLPGEIKAATQVGGNITVMVWADVDDDMPNPDALKDAFWAACKQQGVTPEQFNQVVFALAKDRIENWIEFLNTSQTDELREGPRVGNDNEAVQAANRLAELCRKGARIPNIPASHAWSCRNWKALVERMR